MKISRTTILLTALLASSAVSYSVNATEMPSPATNCKMSGQMCMDKELGSLERAVNGKPVQVVEGQNVRARFFSSETELPALETRITILPGEEPHWSYVLAKAINDQHPDLQAGFRQANGEVTPEQQQPNSVYAKSSNVISHVEVSFN